MGSHGILNSHDNVFSGCVFRFNGDVGAYSDTAESFFYNCLFHGNTQHGAHFVNNHPVTNCVFADNGGAGARCTTVGSMFTGCRFTGNGNHGLYNVAANMPPSLMGCYFDTNAVAAIFGSYFEINPDGAGSWNELSGSDVDSGYVSPGSPDYNYNLVVGATLRSKALVLAS
jgi:hypothetical protein